MNAIDALRQTTPEFTIESATLRRNNDGREFIAIKGIAPTGSPAQMTVDERFFELLEPYLARWRSGTCSTIPVYESDRVPGRWMFSTAVASREIGSTPEPPRLRVTLKGDIATRVRSLSSARGVPESDLVNRILDTSLEQWAS